MFTASNIPPSTLSKAEQARVGMLYAAKVERLQAVARKILGEEHELEAEDVVQDAFLVLLEQPALPKGNLASWLSTVVRRRCRDRLREMANLESDV